MKFDLAALALRSGQRRKVIPLALITPTAALENELAAIYMEIVRAWAGFARNQMLPAYRAGLAKALATHDGLIRDDVQGVEFEAAGGDAQISRLLLALTPKLRRWVVRVEQWHSRRWVASVQPTGVNLATLIGPEDVKVSVDAVLQANIALIRNVSDEARSRIAGIVFRGFTARTPTREIAKQISDGLAMSRKRALRIASDQTTKLSAALTKERQQQAGIKSYIWRHSYKRHPRIVHLERNGLTFKWSNPPSDGPPSTLPFCGCQAQPILEL